MVKFKWEGEVKDQAGVATYFLGSTTVRVPLPTFAIANELHNAIEYAQETAVSDARKKMALEIAEKYGAA